MDYKINISLNFNSPEGGIIHIAQETVPLIWRGFLFAIGGCNDFSSDCIICVTAGIREALSKYKMVEEKL